MKIKRHSDMSITVFSDIDKDNNFEATNYTAIDANQVAYSRNLYKIFEDKLRVPKSAADGIESRLTEVYETQMKNIEKNQGFLQKVRLIPSNYRYIKERQTVHKCSLCGGQHYTLDCPLKQERQRQVGGASGIEVEQYTYSVCLDPIPHSYDQHQISLLVQSFFDQKRPQATKILDRIVEIEDKLKEQLELDESENLEEELQELKAEAASLTFLFHPELCRPGRIAVMNSRINTFGVPGKDQKPITGDSFRVFVHFTTDEPARLLATADHIKLKTENTKVSIQYQGKRAQNRH